MYITHSNVGIGVPWADSWACQPWRVLGTLPTSLTGTRDETVTRRTDYTNEEPILLHPWCSQRCEHCGFPFSVLPSHQLSLAASSPEHLWRPIWTGPFVETEIALHGIIVHGVGRAEEGMCQPRGQPQAVESCSVLKPERRLQFFQCLPGGSSHQPPFNCAHLGPQIHLWVLPCTHYVPGGLPATDLTS